LITSLVTGGAGFIGSHLAEALVDMGRRVIVLDDLSTGRLANLAAVEHHPSLSIITDTITNEGRLSDLVAEADEVYHLAATVGVRLVLDEPVRTVTTNVGPTEVILRQCSKRRIPLFLASTSEVYGKNPKLPLAEDDDLLLGPTSKGRWIYACSKAMDEYLALGYAERLRLPIVVGRFFNCVGPRQVGHYGMVLPRFVDQALSGGPLIVYDDGRQVRCFGHVADIVRGLLALMACPAAHGRVFNLGSDQPISIRELADAVVRAVDPALEVKHIPYSSAYAPGFEDIRCRIPDLTRIRQTIGYESHYGVDDIIREVIAWRRAELGLPQANTSPTTARGPSK
jgi:UDP-glucose 4-epimerase